MTMRWWIMGVILGLALIVSPGCDVQRIILKAAVEQNESYFHPPGSEGWNVEKLTDHVYTFQWEWYRNIFVVTDEGVFATDPFNPRAAAKLREAIRETAGDKPVKYLFYTHYHKDHTEGGAVLEPEEVLCHEKCARYFSDFDSSKILPPTRTLSGDEEIVLGGVLIRLYYLGKTHTDTLYAVHIPGEKLLFTADFGLVRTFPPIGYPDFYRPGTIAAGARIAKLDFDIWVPSHFGYGSKQDFTDYFAMTNLLEKLIAEASEDFGRPYDFPGETFAHVYDGMKPDYGEWHGFGQMIPFSVTRTATGQLLGY